MDWTKGKLAEGLMLYEGGEFFAAHEAWEAVWLELQGVDKLFLQGIIQVAAAFHHYQRGNVRGTVLLLQAALRRLEVCGDVYQGIRVAQLRSAMAEWIEVLEAGGDGAGMEFPRICLDCG